MVTIKKIIVTKTKNPEDYCIHSACDGYMCMFSDEPIICIFKGSKNIICPEYKRGVNYEHMLKV
jgi:hypothetical protein